MPPMVVAGYSRRVIRRQVQRVLNSKTENHPDDQSHHYTERRAAIEDADGKYITSQRYHESLIAVNKVVHLAG